jgi:hypothetical protein
MSSAEFSEWMVFYELEPFGRNADFQGHALTAAMVQWRSLQKNEKPLKIEELMPKEPTPPQSPDQMKQIARALTIALGGKVGE